MKRKEGGFTIVEVVIAVTVISVLLIIAMTTFNGLTAKGRDATRRARAEAMALDLERYYKYNTTFRGHEYPTGNALLADIGKYFSDTTVVQDPSRSGNRLIKGCPAAGPIPASWGWTDELKTERDPTAIKFTALRVRMFASVSEYITIANQIMRFIR